MPCPICHTDATRGDGHRCVAVPGPGSTMTATAPTTAPTTAPAHRTAAPVSTTWQNLAWTAIGLACLYLAACLFRIGYSLYETGRTISLLDNPQPDGYAQIQSMVSMDKALSPLLLAAMVGCVITYFVFLREARTTVQAAGFDARVVVRHWGVALWRAALVVNVLLSVFLTGSLDPSAAASSDIPTIEAHLRHASTLLEVGLTIRCVAAVGLIVAVAGLRGRIRRTLAPTQP